MVTIEMVEEFRRRTNCSYDDAKYYLRSIMRYAGSHYSL